MSVCLAHSNFIAWHTDTPKCACALVLKLQSIRPIYFLPTRFKFMCVSVLPNTHTEPTSKNCIKNCIVKLYDGANEWNDAGWFGFDLAVGRLLALLLLLLPPTTPPPPMCLARAGLGIECERFEWTLVKICPKCTNVYRVFLFFFTILYSTSRLLFSCFFGLSSRVVGAVV